MRFQGGTLNGVTYDGTLDLSPNSSSVYIANGLTATGVNGTGPGTVNLTGTSDNLFRGQHDLRQRHHQSRQRVRVHRFPRK